MKKVVAIVLCLVMATLGAASALAVFNAGANSAAPAMSIQEISGTWAPDGTINVGTEYYPFTPDTSMMSFNESAGDGSNTDTALAEAVQWKAYASFDNSYLYLAFDVDTTTMPAGFFQDQGDNSGNMWQDACIQVSLANMDQTDPSLSPQTDRTEYGFGLTSDTNTMMFTSWNENTEQRAAYNPVAGTDYDIVKTGNDLIYEVRLPWSCFSAKDYTTGDQFALNWVIGAGDSSNTSGTNGGTLIHIQFSQGCSETKDATLYGHISMLAAPAVTTTAAVDTTAPAAGDTTIAATTAPGSSAQTGDNSALFFILLIASGVVLCGVVAIARKARG